MAFESWRRPDVRSVIAICAVSVLLATRSLTLNSMPPSTRRAMKNSSKQAANLISPNSWRLFTRSWGTYKKQTCVTPVLLRSQAGKAMVTLVFEPKFAEGIGTEQFFWHVEDNGAALYRYQINSHALVMK